MCKKAFITGITGQDGAYLSQLLLEKGYVVEGASRDISMKACWRFEKLGILNQVILHSIDVSDKASLTERIIESKPDEIYHFAGSSSVGQSFIHPYETFKNNSISIANILEATLELSKIKKSVKFLNASSSEIFGSIENLPATEKTPINPTNPYGVSKAAGHLLTQFYRKHFDLFAVNAIFFNHESSLRGESFFFQKLIRSVNEIKSGEKELLEVGNIDISRDFGYAPKYMEAAWMMLQGAQNEDYIISSNSASYLRDIIEIYFKKYEIDNSLICEKEEFKRGGEPSCIYGDNSKIKKELNWSYDWSIQQLLEKL